MKFFFTLCCILLLNFTFSQNIIPGKYSTINNSNYTFLDTILKNKKIVLLGEQSHGDGATFDEKVNLIKYLHEKQKYNSIVFESGMYDQYKAFQEYSKKKTSIAVFDQSILDIWSDTKAFQNLLLYIEECAQKKDTIKILGFDTQEGVFFSNHFMSDLTELIKNRKINIAKNSLTRIEKAFVFRDLERIANNKKDSTDLYQDFHFLVNALKEIKDPTFHEKMMKQVIISKISDVDFEIMQLQNQKIAVQNPRDEQMAKNLIFLSEMYPNEKMICWGASYHFSKNIDQTEYTEVTESYLQKQSNIELKTTGFTDYIPGEGAKLLEGALPMGGFLKNYFKDEIYSIAFSSYEGSYGRVDGKSFPILTPPENSIELQNANKGYNKTFFEFDKKDTKRYYCSAFGNIPIKARWNAIFDGFFFIKKSYQPEARFFEKENYVPTLKDAFVLNGKINDFKNHKIIANADIIMLQTNKSILANKEGAFSIIVDKAKFNNKIIVSAFGYISDTISIKNLVDANKHFIKVKLRPFQFQAINLNEVVINSNSKLLSAEEIVAKAQLNIELNYNQNPYNQTFFFRNQVIKNNEVISQDESIITTYNSMGMKGVNNPDEKIFGEILQTREIVKNTSQNKLGSMNTFAFLFDRDLILSKANVLYKPESYTLKKEGIVPYNDQKVYKISFQNNEPGAYSTGYGYPAPKKSSGVLYIDTQTFAILKYEHCVAREPFEVKSQAGKTAQMNHKITITYKLSEGKYFINYLNVIDKSIITSTADNSFLYDTYNVNNLMSTEVKTTNTQKLNRPLLKIGLNNTVQENLDFWKNNSFILPDEKIIFDLCY
ncbi:erythromycin esterase family protein [Flavobacterium sp. KACC 22761]|uniref:erythromycin esterase family protein n=1 Tax=Flavobacterium sp. KACC 22761 TaxID=3092665 RepID=UPI002A75C7BD|nr:erythromycin esterase family protein [Flavobacterium sp. KACC 22761]WPO79416.1 erythromycin esterase family protein [Flavobacterium sp. KACC 22761]